MTGREPLALAGRAGQVRPVADLIRIGHRIAAPGRDLGHQGLVQNYQLNELQKRPGKTKTDAAAAKVPVSVRIDAADLALLKNEAARLGLPYQTLETVRRMRTDHPDLPVVLSSG